MFGHFMSHPRFQGGEGFPPFGPGGRGRGRFGGPGRPGGPAGFGGPFGRRGGRMFGQGDLRLVVLQLIAESPRHGYELIKAIEERFGGQYAPSPGAIYPTLSLLEEQDLIEPAGDSADGKKRFRVTAAGQALLAGNRDAVDGVMARMRMAARALAGEAPPEAIVQAVRTLKQALFMRPGAWTEAEASRISALILAAAEAIVQPPAPQPGPASAGAAAANDRPAGGAAAGGAPARDGEARS